MEPHDRELELRRSTFQWLRAKYDLDPAFPEAFRAAHVTRREQSSEALALVDELRRSSDLAVFRDAFDRLTSRKDSTLSLSGPNGQMVINMVANLSPDPIRGAEILSRCIAVPSSDEEAASKITDLVDYFDEIRTGTQPQAGRAAPFLSVFWMLQDEQRWPARWATAITSFDRLGWHISGEPAQGYLDFAAVVRDLGDPIDVLGVLRWYSEVPWLGPDPTIERRIAWAREMREAGTDDSEAASWNADAMIAPLRQAGDDLGPLVGTALDRPVSKRMPPRTVTEKKLARYDAYVVWHPEVTDAGWQGPPGLRLWFSQAGVFIGLHPGYRGTGWVKTARPHLDALVPPGLAMVTNEQLASAAEPKATQNNVLIGRLFSYDEFDWDSTRQLVTEIAEQSLPLLQSLLSDGPTWGTESSAPADEVVADSELAALFAEFVADWGYPRPSDVDQQAAREGLAALLSEQALPSIDVAEFRRVMNTSKYGFAGNRSILNVTLADPDEDAVQALVVDVVADLLYGPGTFEERLDRCPDRLKGLGQAGAMKLLAIAHPDRFLPIYPLTGAHGKLALLPLVGITDIPTGSPGTRAVRANDLLRDRLGSIEALTADPWGQMVFAYWLRDRETEEPDEGQDLETRLAEATDRCTLPPGSPFLGELLGLLEDKGQIVLYGPPGTGKTYLALELALALAPEEDRRSLVQFHPSMAYEDFMEGFRPVLRDGNLTYELTKGPLVELADKAALDGRPHVLIIDEMNRANLPKVFGELLFLLEYRDHPVKLAYRTAEETFALPKNLWIIGTMNLADRSVGQIDAALRRRFAFVPFTPSDEQNGGLLRRWLTKMNLPVWPADVVDEVNTELESDLGHADLLIGPSYFMKASLDEAQMAVIWRYAIEPLMSDLFHGDQKLVQKYGWELVRKRHIALMPGAADVPMVPAEPGLDADD